MVSLKFTSYVLDRCVSFLPIEQHQQKNASPGYINDIEVKFSSVIMGFPI